MTEDDKRRITEEAKRNIADADALRADTARRMAATPGDDPLTRYREEAARYEQEAREGKAQLRREEARRLHELRQQPAPLDPDAWDRWFEERLSAYLPTKLVPVIQGIAEEMSALLQQELRLLRSELAQVEKQLRDSNRREPVDITPPSKSLRVN